MYVVYFRLCLNGMRTNNACFHELEEAQEFWDDLNNAGWYMVSQRP